MENNRVVFFSYFRGIAYYSLPFFLNDYEHYYVVNVLPHLEYIRDTLSEVSNYFEYKNNVSSTIKRINKINPVYLFVWNGWFGDMHKKFIGKLNPEIKIVYIENGWFPQVGNISIHKNGPSFHSDLTTMSLEGIEVDYDFIQKKRYLYYWEKIAAVAEVENYILIPLQMDGDTQLEGCGNPFEDQRELIELVRQKFPDRTIVVKIHPRANNNREVKRWCKELNCRYVQDKKIRNWIYFADFVVGINSTVLIEALFLYKKVAAFGKNVYSNKNIVLDCSTDKELLSGIDQFEMNESRKKEIDKFITLLYRRQFSNKIDAEDVERKERLLALLKTF